MNAQPRIAETLIDLPGQIRVLTAQTFQWVRTDSLTAAIGAGSAALLYLIFVGIRLGVCRWLGEGHDIASWRGFVRRMVGRTRSFFLAALAVKLVVRGIAPPGTLADVVSFIFTVAAAFQGAIWVRELILGLVARRAAASAEDHSSLASAMGIITVLVNVVVWSVAAILVLDNLNVNVTGLVAGLGVGGIAIGLAAQGIFGDLFAALAILFDRPFRVGDQIKFGDVQGDVEAIGLKTVRIRALTGEQVIISNSELLKLQIANQRRILERRVVLQIGVIYQTTPDQLDAIPSEIEAIIRAREHCRFDRAHFFRFGDSSLDFEIVFHVTVPEYNVLMTERHVIGLAMIRRFAEMGVEFAYPTQTSFTAGLDGKAIDPRELVPSSGDAEPERPERSAGSPA
ncbi:mechanosensitive ion channel family protein [Glacieibacterium frigidum]|uniref:Mechanosensitive ion channel family protein n=2 Tax=Glacieibacterium frigidum TaxID=2593303 RepID=A0A552UJM0_9SPHN|nr:mechanosensitive ion channel family protein [Glacieibacterium frigidum]